MTHHHSTGNPIRGFYPYIFFSEDMERMELALRSALFACRRHQTDIDVEQAALLVLRLYRMGLTEPEKLAILTTRMLAHRRTAP
ncbi:hypothetical protein ACQKGC_05555 [Allorhizobium pseudoryzae]|uniref:hypothetical protein n=1 Tax=Allorhizobium pseudoryzae TaxID=379684 RepID=UPI003D02DD7E